MRFKTTPLTQLLIFEISGGSSLHAVAAGKTEIHRREGRGFGGYNREQGKRPWRAVLAHPSQTRALFIMKRGAGRTEKGIWAKMIKWVHP